jgi:hypothetical protein
MKRRTKLKETGCSEHWAGIVPAGEYYAAENLQRIITGQ